MGRTAITDEERARAARYVGQVLGQACRRPAWWVGADDLKVEAELALWQAELTWEPARGARFSTHAANVCRALILDSISRQYPWGERPWAIQKERPLPEETLSLDAPLWEDEELTVEGAVAGEDDVEGEVVARRTRAELWTAIEAVPATASEWRAALLRALGWTLREVGRVEGISKEGVRHRCDRFYRAARRTMVVLEGEP